MVWSFLTGRLKSNFSRVGILMVAENESRLKGVVAHRRFTVFLTS